MQGDVGDGGAEAVSWLSLSPSLHLAASGKWWEQDFGQQCFTGKHRALALGLGAPGLLIVAVGLPLGTAW